MAHTHDTRIVFTLIRKADMVADTMDKLLEVWSWSLNVCLTGLTPEEDWQTNKIAGGGQQLRDGWRMCVAQARGGLGMVLGYLPPAEVERGVADVSIL